MNNKLILFVPFLFFSWVVNCGGDRSSSITGSSVGNDSEDSIQKECQSISGNGTCDGSEASGAITFVHNPG